MRHPDCECEFPHTTLEGCARQKHLAENIRHSLDATVLRTAYEAAVQKWAERLDAEIMRDAEDTALAKYGMSVITCMHCQATSGLPHKDYCPLWSHGIIPRPPEQNFVAYREETSFGVTPAPHKPKKRRTGKSKLVVRDGTIQREEPRTPMDREAFTIAIRYHFNALFELIDRAKQECRISTTMRWDHGEEKMVLEMTQDL
jgi:hypothetical protein